MPDEVRTLPKFTGIWQANNPLEQDWIEELFKDYVSSYVTDGKHELVLDNAVLFDAFCAANDPAYYAQFKGKNAFLVHFLDENYEGSYEIYENFRGVLRCHWSDAFNPKRVMRFPLGYTAGLDRTREVIKKASERRYVWSFLGQMSKSSRPDMAHNLAKVAPNFCFATDGVPGFAFYNRQADGSPRLFPRDEYGDFLFESAFSPCPMGNVNLECFRVYESLECGAIPIVEKRLTLDYFTELLGKHPLPAVRSWGEARNLVADLIAKPGEMDALQKECVDWWVTFKKSYITELGEFLRTQPDSASTQAAPVMMPRYYKPGWQIREMLRHHDMRAFGRRVQKQVNRIIRTGGTREAYRQGHGQD